MSAAVKIGRKGNDTTLALHLEISGNTCSTLRPVAVTVTTANDTDYRCRSCWTPARIAAARELVDVARAANVRKASSKHRWNEESELIALRDWFLTSAEKARHAELVARRSAPIEIAAPAVIVPAAIDDDLLSLIEEPVGLSALGKAARRAGANVERTRKTANMSTRRRLNIHARFAQKVA